jgi:hypothetical protein
MDRLELGVCQRRLRQDRGRHGGIVEKPLKQTDSHLSVVRRRRNETGVARACSADPVLRAPGLAGIAFLAPTTLQQQAVNLSEKTQAQGEPLFDPVQAVVHRPQIVRRLLNIPDRDPWCGALLEEQQV